MPTYDYKCKKCKHQFEEVQSMSADRLVLCPVCKTKNLVRLISKGGGMIFKGSGFYQTDYKNAKSDTKETKPSTKGSKPKAPTTSEDKSSSAPKPEPPSTPAKPKD
jgi:putative FmdB family regulatory protein